MKKIILFYFYFFQLFGCLPILYSTDIVDKPKGCLLYVSDAYKFSYTISKQDYSKKTFIFSTSKDYLPKKIYYYDYDKSSKFHLYLIKIHDQYGYNTDKFVWVRGNPSSKNRYKRPVEGRTEFVEIEPKTKRKPEKKFFTIYDQPHWAILPPNNYSPVLLRKKKIFYEYYNSHGKLTPYYKEIAFYKSAFVAKIIQKNDLLSKKYFMLYEHIHNDLLGGEFYKPLFKANIKLPENAFIDAVKKNNEFIELTFPKKLTVENIEEAHKRILKYKYAILASKHALSLVQLELWDGNFGKKYQDNYIEREIYWFNINSDGMIDKETIVHSFSELSKYAKRNIATNKFLDKKSVFKNMNQFFNNYNKLPFHYVIFIKDCWDVIADEIDSFKYLLEDEFLLNKSNIDILTTKTVTTSTNYLLGLAGELGGRVYESKSNIHIILDYYPDRLNGKMRRCLKQIAKMTNTNINPISIKKKDIIVQAQEPYFQFGNLLAIGYTKAMLNFFEALKSINKKNEIEVKAQLKIPANVNNVQEYFQEYFVDFELPLCPLTKNDNFYKLFEYCKTEKGKKYFTSIYSQLKTIIGSSKKSRVYFVPNSIFLEAHFAQ